MTDAVGSFDLTKPQIDAFTYRGGWDVRWDGRVPGLGVRIYPSGRKSFVFSYRTRGRKRLIVLGSYGELTLVQARQRAERHRVDVRDGKDPRAERRQAAKKETTFQELFDKFLADYAKIHKKSWQHDEQRWKRNIPSRLQRLPLSEITAQEVSKLHKDISKRSVYEANRTLSLISRMFTLARRPPWGFVQAGSPNPAADVEKNKERKRKVFVQPHEMPGLTKAIDAEENVYVRAALWAYLLTGCRKSELLGLLWADLDLNAATLRLPDPKGGEEQKVALSTAALAIFRAIPQVDDNEFVFIGRRKGRPLVNIDKPWRRIRKKANLEHIRLHDLRRTVGSWMTASGVDLNSIKTALRHKEISTTLIYAQLADDAAREPFEAHGNRILEMAGKAEKKKDE